MSEIVTIVLFIVATGCLPAIQKSNRPAFDRV